MKNCISLDKWEIYGHCLDTLTKSRTIISVANATQIELKGTWSGTVQVGETGALSSFEIFNCKGAFEVILGKPWLKAVQAQHDYIMDEIIFGKEGEQETITNILEDITETEPITQMAIDNKETNSPTYPSQLESTETPAEEQLMKEWARIVQMNTLD